MLCETAFSLSLKNVIKKTLDEHPEVKEAHHEYLSRQKEIDQVKARFYPQIDIEASVGREQTQSPVTAQEQLRLSPNESSIRMNQLIFDGFGTYAELDRQKARTRSAYYQLKSTKESVALQIADVYIDLLRRSALLNLAQESLHYHKNIHNQMLLRNRAGAGSKADLDQIKARLALAYTNLVNADSNLEDVKSNLERATGLYLKLSQLRLPKIEIEEKKSKSMSSSYFPMPSNIEKAIQLALAEHPELLATLEDIQSAKAQHKVSKKDFWPNLSVELEKNINDNIGGVAGDNNSYGVALRLRYNLYRGGRDRALRQQTAYRIEQAKDIRLRVRRQVVEGVRLSWNAYQTVKTQAKYLSQQVEAVEETKKAYRKQFNIGKRTLLDLLNAESELVSAKSSLIQANHDQVLTYYRVYNALGKLVEILTIDAS